jgi:hypothetical protein
MATRITSDLITAKAMEYLFNKIVVAKTLLNNTHSKYLKQFGNATGKWSKPGSLIELRYPYQFSVFDGNDQTSNFQTPDDTSFTFNLESAPVSVPMVFSYQDLTLDLDDFAVLVIEPAVSKLAQTIEQRLIAKITPEITAMVGTPGTVLGDSATVLSAQAWLTEHLCPEENRYAVIGPRANAALTKSDEDLFNKTEAIAEQYTSGQYKGELHGAEFMKSTLLANFVPGTAVDTLAKIKGGSQVGDSLATDGWGVGTITAGTIIEIDGVYDVNPITKASLGYLKQFSVQATVTSSDTATLDISPAIVATGVYQNVTAGPADNADISIISGAGAQVGKSLQQNILYGQDAFAFVTVPMEVPSAGVEMASTKTMDGVSMSFVSAYDVNTNARKSRLDVLWGAGAPRTEFAIRMTN